MTGRTRNANFRLRLLSAFIAATAICSAVRSAETKPETLTADEKTLQENGVELSTQGVRRYLKRLSPSDQQRRRAAMMVKQLGAAKFAKREAAMRELLQMPHPPMAELRRAADDDDPEVRWRAKKIIKHHRRRATPLLHAVLTVISQRKLTGLTAEVLSVFPHVEHPYGTRMASRAVQATAESADLPLLRRNLRNSNPHVQAACVGGLYAVQGDSAFVEFKPLLQSEETPDATRLAVSSALAEAGRREAVEQLTRLLSSKDLTIRSRSAQLLRAFTGKRFGFAAYDDAEHRRAGVAKWTTWLNGEGRTAELRHPLKRFTGYESFLNGHTLLAFGYRNKVEELDARNSVVWSYSATGAFSAEKLPNGNVLIACYAPKEVIEVSPAKKVVWRMKVPSCLNARLLGNGNILIALHTAKQVWEVSRDKRTVWKYQSTQNCYDAHRLPNGNTMIATDRGIVEVNSAGKTVWQYTAERNRCYGFQPLPNGNVLAALYSRGKVVELTREKRIVWSFVESSAFDAYRLPNGNTLVTSTKRFQEVTPKGEVVWTKTGNQHGRARR